MGDEQREDQAPRGTGTVGDSAVQQNGETGTPRSETDGVAVVGHGGVVEKPKKKRKCRKRGIARLSRKSQAEIVYEHAKGTPSYELAAIYGVSDATISMLLARFKPLFQDIDKVKDYRQIQTELLDATGLQVLKSMNDTAKHDSASLAELARAYDVVNKHSRLTKGLSTSNVSEKSESIVRILPPVDPDR